MKRVFYLIFLFSPLLLSASEEKIALGNGSWNHFRTENITEVKGKKGSNDIVLESRGYKPDSETEFLLNFDDLPFKDESGKFRLTNSGNIKHTAKIKKSGTGAGIFTERKKGIVFQANPNSIFVSELYSGDLLIEFWLYCSDLYDGETIFSIDDSAICGGEFLFQNFKGYIKNRKFAWSMKNYFFKDDEKLDLSMESSRTLIPEKWNHHKLIYKSNLGIFEYFIDGMLEAIAYANPEGKEREGTPAVMKTGKEGKLTIGRNFAGIIDGFKISGKISEEDDPPSTFPSGPGMYQSEIIDLGHSKSKLKTIKADFSAPEETELQFFYILDDSAEIPEKESPEWKPFGPGDVLNEEGRFLKIMVLFFTDGNREKTPHLSEIEIIFEKKMPPLPPSKICAIPGDGKVRLAWKSDSGGRCDGYLVYFGKQPRKYFGTSSSGNSPIDAGKTRELEISGLENGTLYYFAVAPYELSASKHGSAKKEKMQGNFSEETTARPSMKQRKNQ